MKKYLFIFILFSIIACSRQEKAIIRAKIENAGNETAYIDVIKSTGIQKIDSIKIKSNGNLKFTIPLESPGFYQLRFKDGKTLTLLLFPGEKVMMKADFNRFFETKVIDGLEDTKRLDILNDSLRIADNKLTKIGKLYDSLKVIAGHEAQMDSLSRLYNEIMDNHKKYSIQFILKDLTSLSNVIAIYQEYFQGVYVFNNKKDLQFYKLVSDTLTKYFPKDSLVGLLNENYNEMLSGLQKEKLLQIVKKADNHVPDLHITDKNGNILSLSSLRGKIVLLTFWSINEPESIDNLIGLKNVYHKYHKSGFEIYQVSIDKSLSDWKRALEVEKITWPSVCDTAFPNSKTRILYNVNSLSLNYLIDQNQTDIIAKNLSPTDLDKKLSELFK